MVILAGQKEHTKLAGGGNFWEEDPLRAVREASIWPKSDIMAMGQPKNTKSLYCHSSFRRKRHFGAKKATQNHQRVFYPSNDPKKKAVITNKSKLSLRDMKNYVGQLQMCIMVLAKLHQYVLWIHLTDFVIDMHWGRNWRNNTTRLLCFMQHLSNVFLFFSFFLSL